MSLRRYAVAAAFLLLAPGMGTRADAPRLQVGEPAKAASTPTIFAATVKPARIAPGKAIKMTYHWQAVPLDADYSVFVHVVGPDGKTVSQDDHAPPTPTKKWSGPVTYTRTFGIPKDWPDGRYTFIAGLYTALPNNGGWKNLPLNVGKGTIVPPNGDKDGRYQIATVVVDRNAPPPPLDSDGPKTLNLTGYKQTFSEDFNTLSVSAWGPAGKIGTRWIAHKPDGLDFGDARFADPTADFPFTLDKGILRIEARKGDDGVWRGGMLATCDPKGNGWAQKYGYFEMRAKFPRGPGTWPAFWLLTQNHLADRKSPDVEIDIVEQYGLAPGILHSTLHLWNPDDHQAWGNASQVADMTGGFHRYGLLWDAKYIIWYFDGVELFRQPTPPNAHQPMYPLVNLALGGGWPITETPNPSSMYVDYIRVWSRDPKIPKLKAVLAPRKPGKAIAAQ